MYMHMYVWCIRWIVFYPLFYARRCTVISELMINEQIRDKEIRLIGENGEQLGIMSAREAMKLAEEAELDLVKIAPTAKPPVCKIIDYGKYRYELARKEKEAKKKQREQNLELKEYRLSVTIDTHDFETKLKNARAYVEKGHKVKVSVRFKGRQIAHSELGKEVILKFATALEEVGEIESMPKLEGRSMSLVVAPKK